MGHPPPFPHDTPPGAPPPPPPARGPGTALIVIGAVIAGFILLVAVVVGYLVATGGDGGEPTPAASSGPFDLRVPLTFALVEKESAPPCTGGAVTVTGARSCYTFGEDDLTVRRLEKVRAAAPDPAKGNPGWVVEITLTSADAPGFAELTRKAAEASASQLPARLMGMLVGGGLVSEPAQVTQAITGGEVQISGPAGTFDRAHAEGIVGRLTGR
ncbi:hypothetical protein K8Z49_46485 [Actinomadura madurae]|uniref:SecDF P1 head subdomain domain-containing protein n=1 Tax=Actinomadura madurae TaxID=1993 RepID=A0A1I4XM69_9ACTN|nr:hypothetical protein [Actinomadura madurae]SFN26379.1 hypothetical protein SAMN04489713_101913 [Actinomadura madurae]SPT63530.1 Uncharacterised protein [Actinomadura madurae]